MARLPGVPRVLGVGDHEAAEQMAASFVRLASPALHAGLGLSVHADGPTAEADRIRASC